LGGSEAPQSLLVSVPLEPLADNLYQAPEGRVARIPPPWRHGTAAGTSRGGGQLRRRLRV